MMRLKWLDNNENVMRWIIEGDWTEAEYNQTFETWKSLASNKTHPVDLIMDMQHAGRMPSSAISLAWQSVLSHPKNLGITIIVTNSKLVRTVFKTMGQIYGRHDCVIIFSADWDGAMDILQAAQGSRAETS
jgi:hypothetical protein